MYSRTNSVTMTVQPERFAFPRMATRNTEPEVFTFERIPAQATAVSSFVPARPKKRCTRVMYPAKVRMHLPPPEKNQAKRWLILLCLVVLWQIYSEDPCVDAPLGSTGNPIQSVQSAEEQAGASASRPACQEASTIDSVLPGSACVPAGQEPQSSRGFEQSAAGNSYMVALLVYHRLGGDK